MGDQVLVFAVLAAALVLFILERWRYDMVAVAALLVLTVAGVVPAGEAFAGFGHPAVVTVAAILVVSRGLAASGVVDRLAALLGRAGAGVTAQVAALTAAVTVCSAFMNNVGALALLMPVALRLSRRHGTPPSLLLMPLAFGSLLGGMTTLIGTPPNIIIGTFRARAGAPPFRLFDFAAVGVPVALAGVAFLALVGWRLLPRRRGSGADLFRIQDYLAELRVTPESRFADRPLARLQAKAESDFVVVAVVRGELRMLAPSGGTQLRAGDLLLVEVDPEGLQELVAATGFELAGGAKPGREALRSDEVALVEAVVLPRSPLRGHTPESLRLRSRYGLNLLAVARQGSRLGKRLREIRFQVGDVLLLQGRQEDLAETLATLGVLPLAERELTLGQPRRIVLAVGILGAAVAALVLEATTAEVAFVTAALAMVLAGLVPPREVYRAVDWPVIVLLGAMIPVGGALETTGAADLLAGQLARLAGGAPPALAVATVLLVTMFLSDVMNNAATAVVMAPIALGIAHGLDASADPFLMAVAIGASCAFLTPIGHQSNTLVLGPGGYRFGDYWRLGLPLEILVTLLAVPLILWAWPLAGR